ncbi:Flavinator of succinate dehydrogenase-domain-containing protein [Lipomyces tetrasporus]|uniref:Succinate dehydrogenase assembly factor 2, mitochondrial n=1 Tax=Lipomyces tetrasporus TaxID=54092 RepID=A0AAD7QZD7_9ASCO|nr:Flavinator of succinate dehydrogenase-domain-containing protein [Lipomyces tetrasporus]KAJ8104292.1 Flavinator of succinate dehydrogenase-domain-containing protein [Lipomyces tetrasporus]
MTIFRVSSLRAFVARVTVTRAAPWSLPCVATRHLHIGLVRQNEQSANSPSDRPTDIQIEFRIEPLPRPGEIIEHKRARLLYQSRKRGILETDLLLSRFAKTYLDSFNAEQLEEYDRFLDEYDWDIYYWVTDNPQRTIPEKWQTSEIFKLLKAQVQSQGNEILRMPDL